MMPSTIRTPTKMCTRCRQVLPLEFFGRSRNGFGYQCLHGACSNCEVARVGAWRKKRRHCTGCRSYRPLSEFLIGGRGVRCNRCVSQRRSEPASKEEFDARKAAALEDYTEARESGMTPERATAWIAKGYGVSERTVERWIGGRAI